MEINTFKNIGLALAGGGAKGSYAVGVLKYLWEVKKIDYYRFILGTSTGSLIASKLALASVTGDQQHLIDLEYIYRNVNKANILSPNNSLAYSIAGDEGLLMAQVISGGSSLYDNKPLTELIDKYIKPADWQTLIQAINHPTRPVEVGFRVSDLQDGKAYTYSNRTHPDATILRKALIASTAIPIVMPVMEINGHQYGDGGLFDVNPIDALYDSPTYEDLDAILAISLDSMEISKETKKFDSIISLLTRVIGLLSGQVIQFDLYTAYVINAMTFIKENLGEEKWQEMLTQMPPHLKELFNVDKEQYVPIFEIHPTVDLGPGLEFKQPETANGVDIGFKEAKNKFATKKPQV